MEPGKLELIAAWLPSQPWYGGAAGVVPDPAKAGGFRLEDPEGEVGIEFMVVTDASGTAPEAYLVPLTYRAAPLEGAEEGLVGTSEHGVLGLRWIYDGTHDPVLVAQLLALLQGKAEAQHQNESDTPDPTVTPSYAGPGLTAGPGAAPAVSHTAGGTAIAVAADGDGGPLTLEVTRRLRPGAGGDAAADVRGHVTAGWTAPDGSTVRGVFAALRGTAGDAQGR